MKHHQSCHPDEGIMMAICFNLQGATFIGGAPPSALSASISTPDKAYLLSVKSINRPLTFHVIQDAILLNK